MELSSYKNGSFLIIEVRGRIDAITAQDFNNSIFVLAQNESRIILNCAQLDYLSSAGIRALILVFKYVQEKNGEFRICSLKENIYDLIEMCGMNNFIKIYENIERAVE